MPADVCTLPSENRSPVTLTWPAENLAPPKPTVPPENLASRKWTRPPENLAAVKCTVEELVSVYRRELRHRDRAKALQKLAAKIS